MATAQAPTYDRVLVGSDGSDRAGRAVERAAGVARALGASLTVVGVGPPDKLQSKLDRQVAPFVDDVAVDVRIEDGNPVQVLLGMAEDDGYDLLVLGNKGMSGVERLLLGSIPNKVSHHLPCSLLIVHTK